MTSVRVREDQSTLEEGIRINESDTHATADATHIASVTAVRDVLHEEDLIPFEPIVSFFAHPCPFH